MKQELFRQTSATTTKPVAKMGNHCTSRPSDDKSNEVDGMQIGCAVIETNTHMNDVYENMLAVRHRMERMKKVVDRRERR